MSSEQVGTLQVALNHATGLLATNPAAAAEQASEILKAFPGHPAARLLLASAQRRLGQFEPALAPLGELAKEQPTWPPAHFELGFALGAAGQSDAAITALRHALKLNPAIPDAWRALADH